MSLLECALILNQVQDDWLNQVQDDWLNQVQDDWLNQVQDDWSHADESQYQDGSLNQIVILTKVSMTMIDTLARHPDENQDLRIIGGTLVHGF